MMPGVTKEQTLFWLGRRLRDLEGEKPDMEEMARKGLSYEQRLEKIQQWEKSNIDQQQQIEAFKKAIELVERYG